VADSFPAERLTRRILRDETLLDIVRQTERPVWPKVKPEGHAEQVLAAL